MQALMLLLFGALASLTYACPQYSLPPATASSKSSSPLEQRWFSVPNGDSTISNIPGPWPIDERTGHQALRVCFYNQAMLSSILDLFKEAAALWQPAMAISGLTIEPDCGPDQWDCLCTDSRVRWDAVRILDITSNPEVKRGNQATVGYLYTTPEDRAKANPNKWWHSMLLVRYEERMGAPHMYDVHSVAHEIGHLLGLYHEHQRPNAANEGLVFVCENLWDARRVMDMIDAKTAGVYEDGDTFEKVCTEMDAAERYGFKTATQHMPDRRVTSTTVYGLETSNQPDWFSIMLYPSYESMVTRLSDQPEKVNFPTGAVLKRDLGDGTSFAEVMPGGVTVDEKTREYDYSQATISQGDRMRIRTLYPRRRA